MPELNLRTAQAQARLDLGSAIMPELNLTRQASIARATRYNHAKETFIDIRKSVSLFEATH